MHRLAVWALYLPLAWAFCVLLGIGMFCCGLWRATLWLENRSPRLVETPPVVHLFAAAGAGRELEIASLIWNKSGADTLPWREYPVTFEEIEGSYLLDAILSSEDHRFFEHSGIRLEEIAEASLEHRGGSTIDQQYVKACVIADTSRTLQRKMHEALIAMAADRVFGKRSILQAYANCIYLGSTVEGVQLYGVGAAARHLFGRSSLSRLTVGEAATLAGMLNAPAEYLSKYRSGRVTGLTNRRNRVLRLMSRNRPERYVAADLEAAAKEPLTLREVAAEPDGSLNYFKRWVASQLRGAAPESVVRTTLRPEVQQAAMDAVAAVLPTLNQRPALRRSGEQLNVAVVAMTPGGNVLALLGPAVSMRRAPGSAVKPFVYLCAQGKTGPDGRALTAASRIDPQNDAVNGWRPGHHVGAAATLRDLLARSDNGAPVVLSAAAGLHATVGLLKNALRSNPQESGMSAIGDGAGSEVSLMDLTLGYAAFANGGLRPAPRAFVTQEVQPALKIASPEETYVVLQMMRSVTGDGPRPVEATAARAKISAALPQDLPVAGKTGTSQAGDLWFVGVLPNLIVGVWVGCEHAVLRMDDGWQGATAALPIWESMMRELGETAPDLLRGTFAVPSGVEVRFVDPNRGCIEGMGGVREYFVRGELPEKCSSFPSLVRVATNWVHSSAR